MFDLVIQFSVNQILLGVVIAALISLAAWRVGALTVSGAVAASLIGGFTFGLGGLPASILLLAFFASSSLLSRAFTKRKRAVAANFAKGGRRDWAQVVANGGVGVLALLAAAFGLMTTQAGWVAFSAALAAANADTWATELGVLSPRPPRLITTGKSVPRGTSGGVSLLGSVVALAAALLIGLLAIIFAPANFFVLATIVALSGLLGSFVDSWLGATVQAIYYCPKCKKETERHPLHTCGTQTSLRRGWRWLDNDWVNFLSALAGAILAAGAANFFV